MDWTGVAGTIPCLVRISWSVGGMRYPAGSVGWFHFDGNPECGSCVDCLNGTGVKGKGGNEGENKDNGSGYVVHEGILAGAS